MRILMIGSALTVNGGIQRYILNLLGSMDLARYRVDLLATRALYLLVRGAHKRDLLADVRLGLADAKNYPVRAVVQQDVVPLAVYWSP